MRCVSLGKLILEPKIGGHGDSAPRRVAAAPRSGRADESLRQMMDGERETVIEAR